MSTSEKSLFALSSMTIACALAFGTFTAQAADVDAETVHELDKVTVDEAVEQPGQTVLTASKLDMVPSSTGTITDAFRGESFIQFDRNSRNGGLGAEITPPQISIRGGRNYENNFTINGLSNNNMLNPTGWTGKENEKSKAPGDAQALMISTDLLDNVKILSENVSAEYGDFTGGAIDAQIRNAKTDRWHIKTWARHTRDAWAEQHHTDSQAAVEYPTIDDSLQNEFKRSNVGVTLEGPLADGKLGVLLSYEKSHSSSPVFAVFDNGIEEEKNERDMDTFIARVNTDANNDFYAAATVIYSPYEASGHAPIAKDAAFTHNGGGFNFTLNTRANLSIGTWTNDFGFSKNVAERETGNNTAYTWLYDEDGYANWNSDNGKAYEGTQGDFNADQEQYKFKSVLSLNPLKTGIVNHQVKLGAEASLTRIHADSEEFWTYESAQAVGPDVTGDKSDGIISGQQAAMRRDLQFATDRNDDYLSLAAFIEDTITANRFTVRPGIRISHDDLTHDVNVAPRFFANIDLLNDGRFNVNFGANRYYGSQVLFDMVSSSTHWQTRRAEKRTLNPDGSLSDWGPAGWGPGGSRPLPGKIHATRIGDVETPYTDELTIGASAAVWDTLFKLTAVTRDYKKQIRKSGLNDPLYCSELNNSGETTYDGVTFSAEKALDLGTWGKHYAEFGITWSNTETNTFNWADAWASTLTGGVYVDGVLVENLEDLNAPNFNADWVLTYAHNASFMDDRLRANLLMRYESGSERYASEIINRKTYYTSVSQDHMFNADLSLAYDLIKTANSTLTINMDIMNILDNKNLVNTTTGVIGKDDHYSMGRQFFLGMSYQY